MSARVLREGHDCSEHWPSGVKLGTIVRCDCGKRWIAVERTASTCWWQRWIWPWPR